MSKEKVIEALVNRSVIARELRIPRSSLYLALEDTKVTPDFVMDGMPLYRASRMAEIANLLKTPKIVC